MSRLAVRSAQRTHRVLVPHRSFRSSQGARSAITAAVMYAATISSAQTGVAVPEDAPDKAHHLKDNKGFHNPWPSYIDFKPWKIAPQILWRQISGSANKPDTTPPTVPVRKPSFLPTREVKSLRATWLGHACFLVEFPGGLRVLFDPVFTHRCSPFSRLGPARYTECPCAIGDIPIVDAVVISHSHYDHLSYPTVVDIAKRHPNVQFFVPLGNKAWFESCGIRSVTEMDWWEVRELKLSKATGDTAAKAADSVIEGAPESTASNPEPSSDDITAVFGCLPCQHVSARTPFDKNRTLWASWSVESGRKKVYFAGDTGYRSVKDTDSDGKDDQYDELYGHLPHCPAFKQIGQHRGPFDLGLIPIGAYTPRYIMSPMHANPTDSVHIFEDTKCSKALGMHWGTWVLTEEDVLEPPRLLRKALAKKSIAETGVFDVTDIGESREFNDERAKL